MRHGDADGGELTARGKSDVFNLAAKLKKHVPDLEAVFHSAAIRTTQTAEIVKGAYGSLKAFESRGDLYGHAPYFVYSLSRAFGSVCIITHEPDIYNLMSAKIIENSPLYRGRTNEALIVKYVGDTWNNVHLHTLESQKVVFA